MLYSWASTFPNWMDFRLSFSKMKGKIRKEQEKSNVKFTGSRLLILSPQLK
jgi:hypothetical protein